MPAIERPAAGSYSTPSSLHPSRRPPSSPRRPPLRRAYAAREVVQRHQEPAPQPDLRHPRNFATCCRPPSSPHFPPCRCASAPEKLCCAPRNPRLVWIYAVPASSAISAAPSSASAVLIEVIFHEALRPPPRAQGPRLLDVDAVCPGLLAVSTTSTTTTTVRAGGANPSRGKPARRPSVVAIEFVSAASSPYGSGSGAGDLNLELEGGCLDLKLGGRRPGPARLCHLLNSSPAVSSARALAVHCWLLPCSSTLLYVRA
ncbi:hypothetical protein EJB05_40588, partial [Eragrostis curvula]